MVYCHDFKSISLAIVNHDDEVTVEKLPLLSRHQLL